MPLFQDTKGIGRRAMRPRGELPASAIYGDMLTEARLFAESLSQHKEVVGVALGGELCRGYGDMLSGLDLHVYLTKAALPKWIRGSGPVPHGKWRGSRFQTRVSLHGVEAEQRDEWSLAEKWDASYRRILHDPAGKVKHLLAEKDVFAAEEKRALALEHYQACAYTGGEAVKEWILRRDPASAHQMINSALPSLLTLLFLANDEYPPSEELLLNYSHSLEWKPQGWRERAGSVALIRETSFSDAERRSGELQRLFRDIWGKIVGEERRDLGVTELEELEALQYVADESPSLEEFKKKFGEERLGHESFFRLVEVAEGKDKLRLRKQRFADEQAKGFPGYLELNREMLRHLKV